MAAASTVAARRPAPAGVPFPRAGLCGRRGGPARRAPRTRSESRGPRTFRAARMESGARRGRGEGWRRCTGGSGRRPRGAVGARLKAEAGGQGRGVSPAAFSADALQPARTLRPGHAPPPPAQTGRPLGVGMCLAVKSRPVDAARPRRPSTPIGAPFGTNPLPPAPARASVAARSTAGRFGTGLRFPPAPAAPRAPPGARPRQVNAAKTGKTAMRAARSSPQARRGAYASRPASSGGSHAAAALFASSTDGAVVRCGRRRRSDTIIL